MDTIKIVFVGPGGVGKTTIRKIFFEQDNPIKLLEDSLEPTYGVETALYDVGKQIAVHDLAGQQLDEWLSDSDDVFTESDLIMLVLDATDPWEEQTRLIEKVIGLKRKCCNSAYYAVLFHKIDLLDEAGLQQLNQLRSENYDRFAGMHTFMTSIKREYFFDAFKTITSILRKTLSLSGGEHERIFSKMMVLNQFINQNELVLDDLEEYLDEETTKIKEYVDELKEEGFLMFKESLNSISLSEKGKETLNTVRNRLVSHLESQEVLRESKVKGLIVSDHHGKTFLTYEAVPGFFAKLVSNEQYSQDPQFIAMFFSAVLDFGKTIDKQGFKESFFLGETFQISIISYQDIAGIFISEGLTISQDVRNSLRIFLTNFYAEFKPELDIFRELNGVQNVERLRDRLEKQFIELGSVLKHLGNNNQREISEEKIIDLYMDLESKGISIETNERIKDLLFKYTVSRDMKYLVELDRIIAGNL